MKTVSMSGSLRESVGKKDAKKNRAKGLVPCVLYGGESEVHFTLDERDFKKIIFTPDTFHIKLTVDGNEYESILQDVQYHPVTDKVLHADFLEINTEKPIKVALPVRFKGNAIGVINGGVLVQNMRKLVVKGLLKDIPEYIEIDISKLKIGDGIKVEELKEEKLDFLDVHTQVVVGVKVTRMVMPEEEEEEEEEEGEGEGAEGEEGSGGEGEKSSEEKSE